MIEFWGYRIDFFNQSLMTIWNSIFAFKIKLENDLIVRVKTYLRFGGIKVPICI